MTIEQQAELAPEAIEPEVEVKAEETTQQEGPSAIEQRALEMGWKPLSEFEGDEDDFIDAKEFVRRKPLFEKIDHQGRELKDVRKALKVLQDHHTKVREAEYKRALQDLREEKKTALREGNEDRLVEIDEEIAEFKANEAVAAANAAKEVAAPHPNFVAWVNRNTWYKDAELRVAADQVGTAYAASNPSVNPDEVLAYVEKRIKKMYPERFTNPNKDKPSAVEGASNQPRKASQKDSFELDEDERKAMNTFVRSGIMTKEEYISELKRVKGIA